MASNNAYGPQAVTEGLVLCLDANNAKSYPGVGTTWRDLSTKGNHATLVHLPVFGTDSATSGSYFDFDMSMLESDSVYALNFIYKINGKFVEQSEEYRFRVE